MIAKIEEDGLKVFARGMKFLSGIGNDIFFQAKPKELIVKAINSSQTWQVQACFCAITLLEGFFGSYELAGTGFKETHCSVSARPLLHILKIIKNVRSFNIRLDSQKELLAINTQLPNEIEFINSIRISEHENLECPGQSKSLTNIIICHSKVFAVLLHSFPKNLKELSLEVSSTQLEISNHISFLDKDVQTVRLNYKFESKKFIEYNVSIDTKLIVLAKDFLSIIELAESSCGELKIAFSKNGRPVTIKVGDDPVIQVEMVLSSLREGALKTLAKPPEASSYKELMGARMGGYLGDHTNNKQQDDSESVFTDTSLIRAISPSVTSYGQGHSSQKIKKPIVKRKSTEFTKDEALLIDEPSKKQQKVNKTLTQNEEREVSQIIATLAGLRENDEDDFIEILNSQPKQQLDANDRTERPPFDSFLGNEPIKVGLDKTFTNIETNSDSASIRFDISKARLPINGLFETSGFEIEKPPSKQSIEKANEKTSETLSQKARNLQSKLLHETKMIDLDRVRKKMKIEIAKRKVHAPKSDSEPEDNAL